MRLPRDWLGPRDELVPFGPRAASQEPGEPPSTTDVPAPSTDESPPTADGLPTASDPPPSADDFWGERSAAIHGALQAPADWAADSTAAGSTAAESNPDPAARGPVPARAIHLGRSERRVIAAATAGAAAAAVTVIAVVSILGAGGSPQPAGGSKAGVAAVLSGGVSRILQLGLARIDASVGHEGATVAAQSAALRARRTPHHQRAPKPAHKAPRSQSTRPSRRTSIEVATATTASSSAYHPAGIGTYDSSNSTRTNTPTDNPPAAHSSPPHPAAQPTPSRATVSSTGESGALGPIHSPNG